MKIKFNDNSVVECCEDHLWTVNYSDDWKTLTALELIQIISRHDTKVCIPLVSPVYYFTDTKLPFDPYTFGFIMGCITTIFSGLLEGLKIFKTLSILPILLSKSSDINFYESKLKGVKLITPFRISSEYEFTGIYMNDIKDMDIMNQMNVCSDEKNIDVSQIKIPEIFLKGQIQHRIELLCGIFDAIVWNDYFEKSTKNNQLLVNSSFINFSETLIELINSLGGVAFRKYHVKSKSELIDVRIGFCPFHLQWKVEKFLTLQNLFKPYRYIKSITDSHVDLTLCISVSSPDHLYVTDHYIVTHNTIQAVACAAMYRLEWPVLVFTPSSARYHWKVSKI